MQCSSSSFQSRFVLWLPMLTDELVTFNSLKVSKRTQHLFTFHVGDRRCLRWFCSLLRFFSFLPVRGQNQISGYGYKFGQERPTTSLVTTVTSVTRSSNMLLTTSFSPLSGSWFLVDIGFMPWCLYYGIQPNGLANSPSSMVRSCGQHLGDVLNREI